MGLFDFLKNEPKNEPAHDPLLESMVKKLGYPYRLLPEMTPGALTELYIKELERGRKEGFSPVILAADKILDEYFDTVFGDEKFDINAELAKISDDSELFNTTLQDMFEEEPDFDYEEFVGAAEGGESINYFMSVFEFGRQAKMRPCALLEIPTLNPWETVVYVPFGGWNACPAPEDMAAFCRQWYKKYGAVPAVITHDTLEFILDKPVPLKDAEALAVRQYIFCTDRIDQCTKNGSAGELADSLTKSKIWYFWWD